MAVLQAIVSTTMEGALLEILEGISDLQAASAATPNPITMITSSTRDGVTGEWAVSLTIPTSSTEDATTGQPVVTATPVFP